jgi:cytochrome c oxidase subunit III
MMRHPVHMGMALFLAAESVLFLMLLLAFVYFGEPSSGAPHLGLSSGIFATACLFIACVAISQAVAGRKKMRVTARAWIVSAIIFGAAFVLAQCREYGRLLAGGLTIGRNLFGTTFFTLTGVHLLHVLVGLVSLVLLIAIAPDGNSVALQAAAMYWCFLGVVWGGIFLVVYLRVLL